MAHFEELWVEAETLLQQDTNVSDFSELAKEAMGKLNVLDGLHSMSKMSNALAPQEMLNLKANAMGKLLLVMTQMSAKDGINVFAALKAAMDDKKITIFESKYK